MLTGGSQQQQAPSRPSGKTGAPSDDMGKFVSRVLGATEVAVETDLRAGRPALPRADAGDVRRRDARRCLRAGAVRDGPVLLPGRPEDLSRHLVLPRPRAPLQGLRRRPSSCQFAQAYVIAHEVGHHVQNQLGILPKVQQQQRGLSKAEANRLQVKVELQADCFAGVWANKSDQQVEVHRAGRRRGRDEDRRRDRRRPAAEAGAGLRRCRTRSRTARRSSASAGSMTGLKSGTVGPATRSRRRAGVSVVPARSMSDATSLTCPASTKSAHVHPAQDRGADRLRHALA